MSTQIAIGQERQQWQLMKEQAHVLIASKAIPEAIKNPEQALAIIQYGRELGYPPMTALQNIDLIKGKPKMSANLIGAMLKRAGYDFKVTKYTNDEVVIKFAYPDGDHLEVSYDIKEAQEAGNTNKASEGGKSMYQKYPKEMLYARCLSRGGRIVAPEVLAGVYTTGAPENIQMSPEEVAERLEMAITAMKEAKTTNEAMKVYNEYIDIVDNPEFKQAAAAKSLELKAAKDEAATKEASEEKKEEPVQTDTETSEVVEEAEVVPEEEQVLEEKIETAKEHIKEFEEIAKTGELDLKAELAADALDWLKRAGEAESPEKFLAFKKLKDFPRYCNNSLFIKELDKLNIKFGIEK